MILRQDYVNSDFPIETDLSQSVYRIVHNSMYGNSSLGNRQSGLHGTRPLYYPNPEEVLPILFGTVFNGREYIEFLLSKSRSNEMGKLEISIFGSNIEKLMEIKNKIKVGVEEELSKRRGKDGKK